MFEDKPKKRGPGRLPGQKVGPGKDPGGRPPEYRPEYAHIAQTIIAETGLSIPKLAKTFNVCKTTINKWRLKYEAFGKAIKDGRDLYYLINTPKVERAYLKRALGFSYTEVTKELVNRMFGKELLVTKKVKKYVPGSVKAQQGWLKKRDENWEDSQFGLGDLAGKKVVVEFVDSDSGEDNEDSDTEET